MKWFHFEKLRILYETFPTEMWISHNNVVPTLSENLPLYENITPSTNILYLYENILCYSFFIVPAFSTKMID